MNENSLVASIALFSELYNSPKYKSLADTLAEFIKGAIITEGKWITNTTEITYLLEKIYDFKIPESVVKSTLKNKLKDYYTFDAHGQYIFKQDVKDGYEQINNEFERIRIKQSQLIISLHDFINSKRNVPLSEDEKIELNNNLKQYLLDNGVNDKYSNLISAFVLVNQYNVDIVESLNLVREGLILYQGIRYSSDLNEISNWKNPLLIFLSPEHLFSALGYNGAVYYQIFMDFYNLVNEINNSAKNRGEDRPIKLFYFEETKEEVDIFFNTAEKILRRTMPLEIGRPAMEKILEGCSSPSDIIFKKSKFETDLKSMGIFLKEFQQSVYNYHDFVVEDESVLEELRQLSKSKGRSFDESLCRQFFTLFTKINYYRGGKSKTKFENIGAILLTQKGFALHLAHQSSVKFGDEDIPFAKDIEYMTSRFWFKLNKGFSNNNGLPKSLDIVTKAQVVLSSHLTQTVSHHYDKLQKQVKEGKLNKEQALELVSDLKQKANKPEEINISEIDSSLKFLVDENYFENLQREKQIQKQTLLELSEQNALLKIELEKHKKLKQNEVDSIYQTRRSLALEFESNQRWNDYIKERNWNMVYFIYVTFITMFSIAAAILSKSIKTIVDWLNSIGNYQYFVWAAIILLILVELVFRAYIGNKEKVKNGWEWLCTIMSKNKMQKVKSEEFIKYENEFVFEPFGN